jgi:hypothetical protein
MLRGLRLGVPGGENVPMSPPQTEHPTEHPDRRRRALLEANADARRVAAAENNLRRLVDTAPDTAATDTATTETDERPTTPSPPVSGH